MAGTHENHEGGASTTGRRGWLANLAMFGGLAAAYGVFASYAIRFLYPSQRREEGWQFVAEAKAVSTGDSLTYRAPSGETINVTRRGEGREAGDFVALSSVCPHLGCQVHWEPHNDRYFCPCHNGVFDPAGKGIGGPPGEAGQALQPYALKVEDGLLFIRVPLESLPDVGGGTVDLSAEVRGPGHDPCLSSLRPPQRAAGSGSFRRDAGGGSSAGRG